MVLERWGSQQAGVAWVYYCSACGHMGHRLGTVMVTGRRVACPECRANRQPIKRLLVPPPAAAEIRAFMEGSPSQSVELIAARALVTELRGKLQRTQLELAQARADAKAAMKTQRPVVSKPLGNCEVDLTNWSEHSLMILKQNLEAVWQGRLAAMRGSRTSSRGGRPSATKQPS